MSGERDATFKSYRNGGHSCPKTDITDIISWKLHRNLEVLS